MAWDELQNSLGSWFARQRNNAAAWRLAFFVALGAMVVMNLFLRPAHPHFGVDALPGFWAVFALGTAVIMALVLKKIVAKLIGRREDYYDR
ncbi:hypothetical protein [Megalodesulfovibrio gigas]|uniref:Uncharacterized protein n=1 Tax=Megalodesulfovibrio gigas (strain ATCC 19364 / DSM 1382 / NCIMB 9332 / VKM B-1759) TaxID=1121448 RepID=T2G8G6_MEGG1|nr:hypothetical protein [Megalodesulfovibrio gigas]AGW12182.1 hypothetical protein DGI_0250 [Megalodesulfovibrio gigas DSM 1382 = ATCC 19364]